MNGLTYVLLKFVKVEKLEGDEGDKGMNGNKRPAD